MTKVFVYGTLRPGGSLFGGVQYAVQDIEDDMVDGFDLGVAQSGWFPVIQEGEGVVVGTTLSVDEDSLSTFDRIEGAPFLYTREKVTTVAGHECYVYVGNHAQIDEPIEHGDWFKYLEMSRAS